MAPIRDETRQQQRERKRLADPAGFEAARLRRNAAVKARRIADPVFRERDRARAANYHAAHPDVRRAYVDKNRKRLNAYYNNYQKSKRARATRKKWWSTEKGKAAEARRNARRIYVSAGYGYAGVTTTPEQAKAINAHIRDRVAGFTAKQRVNAETVTDCPVAEQPELSLA